MMSDSIECASGDRHTDMTGVVRHAPGRHDPCEGTGRVGVCLSRYWLSLLGGGRGEIRPK